MTDGHPPSPYPHEPDEKARRHLRRVVIEDRQQKTLDHARMRGGFADDVSPHAHDKATFKLIRQRKELDELTGSDFVVPTLDQWKHWTRMDDWDSRNRLLEQLIEKMRRRSATEGEVEFLIVVTRPAWSGVARRLRRYGGVDLDPRAEGAARRQEAARVNDLDRAELDQIVQDALMRVLVSCPIPLPQRFFGWLKETLAHRALDYIAEDLGDEPDLLPHDPAIVDLLNKVFSDREHAGSAIFAAPASPNHSEWFRTLDVSAMFSLAEEYATYARTASACEKAVHRLPRRQRDVIERHYYRSMTQAQIAEDDGLAPSTVRNSHRGALKNLQDDDALFEVLSAVGKVRDLDRIERWRRAIWPLDELDRRPGAGGAVWHRGSSCDVARHRANRSMALDHNRNHNDRGRSRATPTSRRIDDPMSEPPPVLLIDFTSATAPGVQQQQGHHTAAPECRASGGRTKHTRHLDDDAR